MASRNTVGAGDRDWSQSGGELRPEGAEIPETGTEAGAQVTRGRLRRLWDGPRFVERSTLGRNHGVTPRRVVGPGLGLEGL